jgi:hypothetical protein
VLLGQERLQTHERREALQVQFGCRRLCRLDRGFNVEVAARVNGPCVDVLAENNDRPLLEVIECAVDEVTVNVCQTRLNDIPLSDNPGPVTEEIDQRDGLRQPYVQRRTARFAALDGFGALSPAVPIG